MKGEHNRKHYSLLKRFTAVFLAVLLFLSYSFLETNGIGEVGVSASSIPSLGDVVTGLKSSLSIAGSDRVQNGDTVSGTDSLELNYEFSITGNQVDAIRSAKETNADYCVYIDIPAGLQGIDKNDKPVCVDGNDGTSQQFGTLTFDSSGNLNLRFEGDFWTDGEVIDSACLVLSCRLDMDAIGNYSSYKIKFADSTAVTIKNGDAQPEANRVKDVGADSAMPLLGAVVTDLKNFLYDSDSERVENTDTIFSTDSLQLYYDFSITVGQVDAIKAAINQNSNYSVYIAIPDGLKSIGSSSKPIYVDYDDGSSQQIGTLEFDPSGHGLYFHFEGDFWDDGDVVDFAYIYVSCQLDMDEIGSNTSYRIQFADSSDVTIQIGDPLAPSEIEKEGKYKNQQFTWTITYKPGTLDESFPFTIVDTFDNTFQKLVEGSLAVDGTLLSGSDYEITNSGTTTTIKYVIDTPPSEELVLTYKTELTAAAFDSVHYDQDTTVTNNVSLRDSSNNEISFSTESLTAPAGDKNFIQKEVDEESFYGSGILDWTVTITTHDFGLKDLVLYDTIEAGLILDVDSVRINGRSLAYYGAQLALDSTDGSGNKTYSITFPANGPYAAQYEITYSTDVADEYLAHMGENDFYNKAWLTFNWADTLLTPPVPEVTIGVGVDTHIISKYGTYNRSNHTITWEIEVNPYKLYVTSGTIIDDLAQYNASLGGITYVSESFYCENSEVKLDPSSTNKYLEINVGEIGTETVYVYFDTVVDNVNNYAYNTGYKYYDNTVTFDGYIELAGSQNVVDEASYEVPVNSNVVYKYPVYSSTGTNRTYYDYSTNTITWQIRVNYNNMPMTNAVLEDVLPSYLKLVEGSVCIGSSANPTTPAPSGAVSYLDNKLTIYLGNINTIQYVIFKTTVDVDADPDFKNSATFNVTNSVTLKRDGYNSTQSVSEPVPVTNKTLSKGATIESSSSNKISYAININGNDMDLSDCTLTDTLPAGLKLDFDSVKLWEASISANGTLTKTNTEVPNFKWSYNAADNSFTVELPDTGRYVLTYDCYATTGGTYKNSVSLEGGSYADNVGKASVSRSISGGGGVSHVAEKGNLTITKLDRISPNIKLSGVTFELWTKIGGVDTLIDKGTTDADGTLTFNLLNPNREYWLVETAGIRGYDITMATVLSDNGTDTTLIGEYKFYVTANTTKEITVYNERSSEITLVGTKILSGKDLTDNMFSFVVKDENGNIVSVATNRADGTITFGTIHYTEVGTYRYKVSEVGSGAGEVTYDPTEYNVVVTVVENSDGTLKATVNYPDGGMIFNNMYIKESAEVMLTGTKNLTGKTLAARMFSFIVEDEDGNIVSTGTNDEYGVINFGSIHYTAAGTYRYEVSEVRGSAGEISYDEAVYNVEVEVVDNGDGTLTATEASSNDPIIFNNAYILQSTAVTLTGTKNLAGKALADDMFSFIVKDEAGTVVSTGTNKADGTITFSAIHYTAAGTHYYKVSEVRGGTGGTTYDTTVYNVKVEVVDNGDGTLTATETYTDGSIVFNNTYTYDDPEVVLAGTKNLTGKALTDDMFGFIVEDEGGSIVSAGTNQADGTITFGAIHYTTAGTYRYKVSEVRSGASGVTYDATKYNVVVTVNDNGGTLMAMADYPDGGIAFNNTYIAQSGEVTLTGTKNLTGKTLAGHMFSFIVKDEGGDIVSTGTNRADGTINFSTIHYTAAGTYRYKVSEIIGGASGITYDAKEYNVVVDVVDNGGILMAMASYPDGSIVFNNKYIKESAEVTLTGRKNLTGKALANDMFSFIVKDEGGSIVSAGTNRANGTINFGTIYYTAAGTYRYKVSEVRSNANGMTYDTTEYNVVVTVDENGDTLTARASYPGGSIVFNNTYTAPSADVILNGQKNLTGKTLTNSMFRFIVEDESGTVVSTGTNQADGKIYFTALHHTKAGTYRYKVSEVKGDISGMTYDTTKYNVEVKVVYKGGILTATETYSDGSIVFNNKYKPKSTKITLAGKKNLTGKTLKDNMFHFIVKDSHGNIVSTGSNKSSGKIAFDSIRYTAAGTYKYKVSEVTGSASGITYDTAVYNVTVKVVDNDGKLKAKATYKNGKIVFSNSYNSGGSGNNGKNSSIPKTGDGSMLYGWAIVCVVSMSLLGVLLWLRHKRKRSANLKS